jgi:hypothetical protein
MQEDPQAQEGCRVSWLQSALSELMPGRTITVVHKFGLCLYFVLHILPRLLLLPRYVEYAGGLTEYPIFVPR